MTTVMRRKSMWAMAVVLSLSVLAFGCAQTAQPVANGSAPTGGSRGRGPHYRPGCWSASRHLHPARCRSASSTPCPVVRLRPGSTPSTVLTWRLKIANGEYDLDMPLAKTEGLPNLGGAKIKEIAVDTQGSPEKGQSEAERLITQEHAVALFGAYHSSVTQTASQTAERLGIPYVNGESSSPALTERGLKTFFRTGPHDITYAEGLFQMLDEHQGEEGHRDQDHRYG